MESHTLIFTPISYDSQYNLSLKKSILPIASSLTIGTMKAYTLGLRVKWKDYVDLYFLLHIYSITEIERKSQEIFGALFNNRIFRQQLMYVENIDSSENVEFTEENITNSTIREFLIEVATT